jgi:hypothetical protein
MNGHDLKEVKQKINGEGGRIRRGGRKFCHGKKSGSGLHFPNYLMIAGK